jgi:antitoxin YefM
MNNITYTDARQNLKSTMDKVCETHAPMIITRQDAESVVMMSLEDYNALEETAYLLKSPKNAARLAKATDDVKKRKYRRRALKD